MPKTNKNNKNSTQDVAIKGLQTDMKWIKREITDIKRNHLPGIYKAINDLKDIINKQLTTRPTWFVTLVITALLSILTGLSVYLLTH